MRALNGLGRGVRVPWKKAMQKPDSLEFWDQGHPREEPLGKIFSQPWTMNGLMMHRGGQKVRKGWIVV